MIDSDDQYAVIVRRSTPMVMADAWQACVAGVSRLRKSKLSMTHGFLPKLQSDEGLSLFTEDLLPIDAIGEWKCITVSTTQSGPLKSAAILKQYQELIDIWDASPWGTQECRVVMPESKHFSFPHKVVCRRDMIAFRILADMPAKERFDAFRKFFKLIDKLDSVDLQWDGKTISIDPEGNFGRDDSGELYGVRTFTFDFDANRKHFKSLLGTRADQVFFKLEEFEIDRYLRCRERLNEMFQGWTTEIKGEPSQSYSQWWKTGKGAPSGRLPILFHSREMPDETLEDVSVSIAPQGKSYCIELGGPQSARDAIDACTKAFPGVTFHEK